MLLQKQDALCGVDLKTSAYVHFNEEMDTDLFVKATMTQLAQSEFGYKCSTCSINLINHC